MSVGGFTRPVVVRVQRSQPRCTAVAGLSPPRWVLGGPVYPAVHRLCGWRAWNQARRAPGLGVKERPPLVRSRGLEGRVACKGRELLRGTQARRRKGGTGTRSARTWGARARARLSPAGWEKPAGRPFHHSDPPVSFLPLCTPYSGLFTVP